MANTWQQKSVKTVATKSAQKRKPVRSAND